MVVIVGTVLALIYTTLKPKQDLNRANDTRKQILASIHITPESDDVVESEFNKHITAEYLVNEQGEKVSTEKGVAFNVKMKNNIKEQKRLLPVFEAKTDKGETKYIIPAYGAGLWGPIWGYIALNDDGNTIYGTNFSHESETPGLGARITEQEFQKRFEGKHVYVDGAFKSVEVLKKGSKSANGAESIDAISGATITSRGVSSMLSDCLQPYDAFFKKLQETTAK